MAEDISVDAPFFERAHIACALRKAIALVAAAVVSIAVAGDLRAGTAVAFLGLNFPERVAGAQRGSPTDYEKEAPGLGYSVEYQQPGWRMDVYVYDKQLKSIPENVRSSVVTSELANAKGDIQEIARRGRYAKADLQSEYTISDARNQPRLLCAAYVLGLQDGGNLDSFACVTGWKNRFVKFRMSARQHAQSEAEARQFLKAWIGLLWPR